MNDTHSPELKDGDLDIGVDLVEGGKVRLQFSQDLAWVDIPAREAKVLGRILIDKAREIEPKTWPAGKPILALDFDGVMHRYSQGWQDGTIYDVATPGLFNFLDRAVEDFHVVVYSSRSGSRQGISAMVEWLTDRQKEWMAMGGKLKSKALPIEFCDEKPPAWLTLDDRALTFSGTWPSNEEMMAFKPWTEDIPQ